MVFLEGVVVDVVGVGVSVRVGGDRACQSEGLTDRHTVGTDGIGHPGPSWANLEAFYGFIKLLTPHHPVHRKRTGR